MKCLRSTSFKLVEVCVFFSRCPPIARIEVELKMMVKAFNFQPFFFLGGGDLITSNYDDFAQIYGYGSSPRNWNSPLFWRNFNHKAMLVFLLSLEMVHNF